MTGHRHLSSCGTTLATLQAQDLVEVWVAIRARPKEICAKDLSSCLAGLCDAPRSSHHLNYYIHILMSLIHQHMLQHCQSIHIFKQKYHMYINMFIYLYTNYCLNKASKKTKAQVSQVDLHTKRVPFVHGISAAQRLSNACRQAALIESLIAFVRGFREEGSCTTQGSQNLSHPISLHLYKYNWYPVSVCVNPSIAALHNSGLLPYTLCRKSSGRSRVALDKSSVARELQGALLSWFPSTTSLILCGCSLTTHANHEDTQWEQLDTVIHAGIVGIPK